jgi:alpha-L-rhamnosidase
MSNQTTPKQWAQYAKALTPPLQRHDVCPGRIVKPVSDAAAFQEWRMDPLPDEVARRLLSRGDTRCWDFGDHFVGYLKLRVSFAGVRQDAPVKLRVVFGEMPREVAESFSQYHGWISAAWLQEEIAIVDQLPCELALPRRYAFRYVQIEVIAASKRFGVTIDDLHCEAVTSADERALPSFDSLPTEYREIYRISLRTLRDCMQLVCEDGPKRDRRLWLGDLRLQALAHYVTYRQNNLVKRCLCMFCASALPGGKLPASVYDKEPPLDDESCLTDYSLLFVAALDDYSVYTDDNTCAREMYFVAAHQLDIAHKALKDCGLMTYEEGFTCFIDWNQELDKHAALQGVYMYCLGCGVSLARRLGFDTDAARFEKWLRDAREAALQHYWDGQEKRFRSGTLGQVSWASQIWMVLGGALERPQAVELMRDTLQNPPPIAIATPYLTHYLVEALFSLNLREEAMKILREYWGGMVALGADTFWEIYLPENPAESPYEGNMIHSYCHAWSCTPAYYLWRSFS